MASLRLHALVRYYIRLLFCALFFYSCPPTYAQLPHPHILVRADQKTAILEKIQSQPWARSIFDAMNKEIAPYVERHKVDPQWILSRYLMNRVPGKRYTRFYSDDDGTQ